MDDSISHVCSSDAQKVSKQASEQAREGVEGPDRQGASLWTRLSFHGRRSEDHSAHRLFKTETRVMGGAEGGGKRKIIYKAEGKSVRHRRRKRRYVI